jgi:cytochrome b561
MRLRNSGSSYGAVSVASHWLVAIAVTGLFVSGLWMVGLTYYHSWYHRAPELHASVGVLAAAVVLAHLLWRRLDRVPDPEPGVRRWEVRASALVHALLYLSILVAAVSGYLITTAKGAPVEVFGLFSLPATLHDLPGQADLAGKVHLLVAYALIGLAGLHGLAALKHHFIDRDGTLLRMLGLDPPGI